MSPLKLTTDDWVEISAALNSKETSVICANEGPDDNGAREWREHLARIQRDIGPDGETAPAQGIAPVKEPKR